MMNINFLIVVIIAISQFYSLKLQSHAAQLPSSQEPFFSLEELHNAERKQLAPLEYLQASDQTSLAFRPYLPLYPKAVLVFYHGAGAHSGLIYKHIGADLRDNFDIGVYMPDLRGHGHSGGDRGDAPSDEQVWADINTVVKYVRSHHPNTPIFLGGHSAGSGLILNYSSWKDKEAIDGYVFLAPYFGYRSETSYNKEKEGGFEFSTVNVSDFVIHAMSGGLISGHSKAVKFNFPKSVLIDNPEIVTFNTVNMSNAVTPTAPNEQLSDLQQFGLWIGNNDEIFDPVKVVRFAEENKNENADVEIITIEGENHFSIIIDASQFIGGWIDSAMK